MHAVDFCMHVRSASLPRLPLSEMTRAPAAMTAWPLQKQGACDGNAAYDAIMRAGSSGAIGFYLKVVKGLGLQGGCALCKRCHSARRGATVPRPRSSVEQRAGLPH